MTDLYLNGTGDRDFRHVGGGHALVGDRVLDRELRHVVLRERHGIHAEVALVDLPEVEDHRLRIGAVELRHVLVAGAAGKEARVVLVHDPVLRVLVVIAGQGLAVGPLQAGAELPGDGHRVAVVARDLDAAVVERRDLGRLVGRVLEVVGDCHEAALGRRR